VSTCTVLAIIQHPKQSANYYKNNWNKGVHIYVKKHDGEHHNFGLILISY